jgi:DNA-binding NtrC family response regulator
MSHTILVVDDAPDWRTILAGLIHDVHPEIQVITAASLDEAKALLAQHTFDLAIIDIRLDESDEENAEGLDLMEFICAHYPRTPSLVVTGYANLDTVRRAMHPDRSGARLAVDYIEKDKIHSELLPRLSAIVGKR